MDNNKNIADFQKYKDKKIRAIILSKVDKEVYETTANYHFEILCNWMIDYINNPHIFTIEDKKELLSMLDHFKMKSLVPLTVNNSD